MQALLLEPIQRLPRYKLFLETLLENTPIHHKDYSNLSNSLKIIQNVLSTINENVREYEHFFILLAIQRSLIGLTSNLISPGRILVKKGELMKVCRKNHQSRIVFLFSDLLIYASNGSCEGEYIFHKSIDLEMCSVQDVSDLYGIQFAFKIISTIKSFTVYAGKILNNLNLSKIQPNQRMLG